MTPSSHGSEPVCHLFHSAIELIGRRWTGAILWALSAGPRRFSDFHEAIPEISDRLLSERLKELEEAGVVLREIGTGRPVPISYRLSPKGEELQPLLKAVGEWAARWAETEGASSDAEGRQVS